MTEDESEHGTGLYLSWPVAITLLVALLLAFVVGGWRLTTLQRDYTKQIAASAVKTACVSGNDFRSLDKTRWDGIIKLFGPPPHRAESQAVIDAIEAQTKKADVQRPCDGPHPFTASTATASTTSTTVDR